MKLFVTGATGFIGSHFINAAYEDHHNIVALKRSGSQPRVKLIEEPEWVEGALDCNLYHKLKGCDVLVHFAAHTPSPPYDSLDKCLYWNLMATLQLCNQALKAGVKKFIIAGSSFEFGKSGERYDFIPANAPLEPTMSYPISKASASIALYGWAIENNIQLQILRIFQVFGEGESSSRLWPSLKKAAIEGQDYPMTKGSQVRDFIPVSDVAARFVDSLSFDTINNGEPQFFNVGTGYPKSVLEFSQYWWDKWNAKGKLIVGAIPYRKNEVMRFVPEV